VTFATPKIIQATLHQQRSSHHHHHSIFKRQYNFQFDNFPRGNNQKMSKSDDRPAPLASPDVLCVTSHSNTFYSTEFHINLPLRYNYSINLFGTSSLSSSPSTSSMTHNSSSSNSSSFPSQSSSSSSSTAFPLTLSHGSYDDQYHILLSCNGTYCTNILTILNPNTSLVEFVEENGDRTLTPSSQLLKQLCLLSGKNQLLFESKVYGVRAVCMLYLWSVNDRIVVVDIDGTLTRSDVRGYVETVYLGKYDYIHDGAIAFFSSLEKEYQVRHLYLTSRPLHHLEDTKAFLHLVRDRHGLHLPPGPLFTNRETVIKAIYRELVAKTTAQFKGSVLVDILSLFLLAGTDHSPFCLGVGNKETDSLAYRMAGLSPSRILLVQTNSTIIVTLSPPPIPSTASSSLTGKGRGGGTAGALSEMESAAIAAASIGNTSAPLQEGVSTSAHTDSTRETPSHRPSSSRLGSSLLGSWLGDQDKVQPSLSQLPHRTLSELRFNTYSDPTLWEYVKMNMTMNHVPSDPLSTFQTTLRDHLPDSRPRIVRMTSPLLECEVPPSPPNLSRESSAHLPPTDTSASAGGGGGVELSPPPLPPVNFHGPFDSPSSSTSLRKTELIGSGTQQGSVGGRGSGGRKKLKDMTDFFNPVESADI
jgi:hypothetical protein